MAEKAVPNFVASRDTLAFVNDWPSQPDLVIHLPLAGKVAGWGRRQAERAERAWESSPLIGELRRRGLPEPTRPTRVVGASFSLKKPLAEWTDDELEEAVATWTRLASGGRGA